MTVYVIGWLAMALAILIWAVRGSYVQGSIPAILVYLALLSVFRGDVGTDTEQYQNVFTAVALGNQDWLYEGGFALVANLLVALLPTPELAVRAVSGLFFVLVGIYAARADDDERWVLLGYILPVFAYQYSMNGLRIGLASAVLLICTQKLGRRVTVQRQLVFLAPVTLHYSTLISVCVVLLTVARRSMWRLVIALFLVSITGAVLLSVSEEYFFAKHETYQEMLSPGAFSGLARLAVILCLIIGVVISNLKPSAKALIVIPITALMLGGIFIAQSSYAGLRILDLTSFVAPLAALISFQHSEKAFDNRIKIAMLVAGAFGVAGVANNFVSRAGDGDSPFVPYQLIPSTYF